MRYETEEEKELIRQKHLEKLNAIMDKDFEMLSHNELAFLKCVSLSSIISMKKAGYSKDEMMLHDQQNKAKVNTAKTAVKYINSLTTEQLEALGFKRL